MANPPIPFPDDPNFKVTKAWNGVLFVHQGAYEGGVFKFKIDFPMIYPLNLPIVTFTARQVFSPVVKLETGVLDLARLFELSDHTYND